MLPFIKHYADLYTLNNMIQVYFMNSSHRDSMPAMSSGKWMGTHLLKIKFSKFNKKKETTK